MEIWKIFLVLILSEVPSGAGNSSTSSNVLKEKMENLVSQRRSKSWISNSTFFRLFLFWEVDFDMADIEPSLERSTEISRLGSVLLECPECLLGFGDLWVAKKLADWCAKEGFAYCFGLMSSIWYVFRDTYNLKWF